MNILNKGVLIEGTIKFTGDMDVDCIINGEILSDKGNLTINPNSQIKGDVKAGKVIIKGKAEGNIEAQTLKLEGTADIRGSLTYKTLGMEPGAKMIGQTMMIS